MNSGIRHGLAISIFCLAAAFIAPQLISCAQLGNAVNPADDEDAEKEFPMPTKPRPGCILLLGELESDGRYGCRNPQKPLTDFISPDMRGMDLEAGTFSAEIDKASGEIVSVRMYYDGHLGGATNQEGELDKKLNGSFGKVSSSEYVLSASGTAFEVWDTRRNGETQAQGAVIAGKGDLLAAPDGATFKGHFYIGVDSIPSKTPSKRNCDANITFGNATFRVIR